MRLILFSFLPVKCCYEVCLTGVVVSVRLYICTQGGSGCVGSAVVAGSESVFRYQIAGLGL